MDKLNIAIAGGPCTGKSTLAASLFASLKSKGFDYDLIGEEMRKLKKEFGRYVTAFERFYMWRQQEREELRSFAEYGFITDMPLFDIYAGARLYSTEPREKMAIRELFRMCLDIEDRYQIIVMASDPNEIPYKHDGCRNAGKELSIKRHELVRSFIEHMWKDRLILVNGNVENRLSQVEERILPILQSKLK